MNNATLVSGEVYHIFNKSIAGFQIFNNENEFSRMRQLFKYYQTGNKGLSFSRFTSLINKKSKAELQNGSTDNERIVNIIAYCIMNTHIHLVLKQLKENGISIFMNNILNSYTRYFNVKHKRKGPLWEMRFKRVLITTDEQLLHLTRYIHLNPATAYLSNKPEEWIFSSYREYIFNEIGQERICDYANILDINPVSYKIFVEENIEYQRKLATIKGLILDQTTTA